MQFRIRVLDDPGVEAPGGRDLALPLGKPFALLCLIALEPSGVRRGEAAHLLWPSSPRHRALGSVRQALWILRQQLPEDVLLAEGDQLTVDRSRVSTDLDRFREDLDRGRLREAAEAWGEGPFAGFVLPDAPAWNSWTETIREPLERRLESHLRERAAAVADAGRPADALEWIDRALAIRPFSPVSHQRRIRLLLELHRLDEAEEAVRWARQVADEPRPELSELESQIARLARASATPSDEALRTELVGRSREFSRMARHWRSVLSGRARLVALTGPVGVGLGRLAEEFVLLTEGQGARSVTIRATPAEERLGWGSTAELVRQLHALPGAAGTSPSTHAVLGRLLPTLPGGSPTPEGWSAAALAEAVLDLIDAVCHEGPLVVLVEDLQWVDPPSRALVVRLARSVGRRRLLLLTTCRTDQGGSEALELLRTAHLNRDGDLLEVGPLRRADVREMLVFLLDSPAEREVETLTELLIRASGGYPLFIMELLGSLRETGVLEALEEGRWRLRASELPRRLELTEPLVSILRSRVAGLEADDRAVAHALADAGGAAAPDDLVARSGLTEERVTRAVGSLVARGLVRRAEDGLRFAHDELRAELRRRQGRAGPERAGRVRAPLGRGPVAALVVVVVVLAAATLPGLWPRPASEPYGGGRVFVRADRSVVELQPPGDRDGPWRPVATLPVPDGVGRHSIDVTAHGEVRRFGALMREGRGLDIGEILPDGTVRPFFATSGDDNFIALAPTGRFALLHVQDSTSDVFSLDLERLDLATGERTVLLDQEAWGGPGAAWSPDEAYVVSGVNSVHDTLVVLRPDGRRVLSMELPDAEVAAVAWCGRTSAVIVATLPPGAPVRLWLVDVPSGTARQLALPHLPASRRAACSPDGRSILYPGLVEGRRRLVVHDLETGTSHPLGVDPAVGDVAWPAPASSIPLAVTVSDDQVTVRWGDRRDLAARVTWTDPARAGADGVAWLSRTPSVATVTPDGRLSANGPGAAWVVAEANGWLRDSVLVRVQGRPRAAALLADPLETLDPRVWEVFGTPEPRAVATPSGNVLSLRGDGVFSDGIRSRRAFGLSTGGTLEVDFRLPFTRRDRQRFVACLVEEASTRRVCFDHPARYLTDFDPAGYDFTANGVPVGPGVAAAHLPANDWTRVAIQVRADGLTSLLLDGQPVETLPFTVENGPHARWRVRLAGAAFETELLVRNLVLWPEERYAAAQAAVTGRR